MAMEWMSGRRWRVVCAVVVTALVFVACGGDSGDSGSGGSDASGDCEAVPQANLDGIADDGSAEPITLSDGQGLSVPSGQRPDTGVFTGHPEYLVAATVHSGVFDGRVGVWTRTSLEEDPGGPLLAINEVARGATQWGADAQPGSPAGDFVDEMADSPYARVVESCGVAAQG
jgi:hypothetical protein